MNVKNTPITSSIGAYFMVMSILTAANYGINKLFWIYLAFGVFNGAACALQIYLSSRSEDAKTVTYYFFALDRLVLGLLLVSIYFDLVTINFEKLKYLILFIGVYLILDHLIKKIFRR